jgi:hypothetical protein
MAQQGSSANMRMIFPSFFPGNLTGAWVGGNLILDQPITVLRIAATAKTPTYSTCPAAVFRFTDGSKGQDLVLAPGQYWSDTGPIALTFASGAQLQASLRTGSTCGSNPGADANLLVEYKMRASSDTDSCAGTSCGGICTTTASDPSNCGGCGTACGTGIPCSSGSCGGSLSSNGSPCTNANQCSSGFCSQNVCCSTACTGACVACNLSPAGTCKAQPAGTPAPACSPYECADGGICAASCTSDASCTTNYYCAGGSCVPQQPAGQGCSANDQCLSNVCQSHICQ